MASSLHEPQTCTRRTFLEGVGGTIAIAERARPEAPVRVVDHEGDRLSFLAGDRLLFEYRYAADRPKAYIHPLCSPDGTAITLDGPEDHIHHRGVFLGWTNIGGYDFFGESIPGLPKGRMVHRGFDNVVEGRAVSATARIEWEAAGNPLIVERRTLRAPVSADGMVWVEWDSRLVATRPDLTLATNKAMYNGLGIRFARNLDLGGVLNDKATSAIAATSGERARWAAYYGPRGPGQAGAAIFDHPSNPRHPTKFFVMNKPFGYLSAAPTFDEPLAFPNHRTLRLRYAIVTFAGEPRREDLETAYQRWVSHA